jgi:hypothetical protein
VTAVKVVVVMVVKVVVVMVVKVVVVMGSHKSLEWGHTEPSRESPLESTGIHLRGRHKQQAWVQAWSVSQAHCTLVSRYPSMKNSCGCVATGHASASNNYSGSTTSHALLYSTLYGPDSVAVSTLHIDVS